MKKNVKPLCIPCGCCLAFQFSPPAFASHCAAYVSAFLPLQLSLTPSLPPTLPLPLCRLEKSKWFKELPWEQRMKTSHDEGTLVLLQNLDPEFTSGEVEDIIFHAFEENCAARMVQHIAICNPHYGQAFAIFKTREVAERIVKELDDRCLMLPNNRPLIGGIAVLPYLSEKQTTFVGHFAIDKVRRQMQRDMKEAVSTSHYSQTNTIEYEMAMSWCLLQSKADRWWTKLYEQQNVNLKKLTSDLKLK